MRKKGKWQPKLVAAVLAVGLAASPVQSSLSQAYADSKAAEAVPEETEEKPEKESGSKTEETGKDDTNKVESGEGKLDEENQNTGSNTGDKSETEGKEETDVTEEAEKDKEESCSDAPSENQDKTEGSREESSTEEEIEEGSGSGEVEESGKDTGETDETRASTEGSSGAETEESAGSESKEDTEESTEAGSEEGKEETSEEEETVESSEAEGDETETKVEETEKEAEETKETEEPKEAEAVELSTAVSGVKVTVHADAGVLPEDVKLEVSKITDEEILKNLTEAAGLEDTEVTYETMALDVKLLDKDGEAVQPDTEAGELTVTFEKVAKVLDTKAEKVTVYHFEDEEGTGAEEKEVKAEDDALTVETEHFSPFLFAVKTEQEKNELFSGGSGTQEDPYIIASVDDLKKLAEEVNAGNSFSGEYLKIADDIEDGVQDISSEAWTSIGNDEENPFRGSFDGNGKTIYGLNDKGKTYSFAAKGLFGFISDATIHDLILEEVNFTVSVRRDIDRGALAGRVLDNSTVRNIKASGNITAGKGNIGGIFGYVTSDSHKITVSDCVNEVNLSSSNQDRKCGIGGIVGSIKSGGSGTVEIVNCENRAHISGKKAGGILGYSTAGKNTIHQSANIGMVTGASNAAGIIGESISGGDAINNCYNSGSITATGNRAQVAGIYTGLNSNKGVNACLNIGVVSGSSGTNITVYQIGQKPYGDTAGETGVSSYYIVDGKIFLSSSNGKDEGEPQDISTKELAKLLNEAGGDNFWKIQDGTILPGIMVEEESSNDIVTGIPQVYFDVIDPEEPEFDEELDEETIEQIKDKINKMTESISDEFQKNDAVKTFKTLGLAESLKENLEAFKEEYTEIGEEEIKVFLSIDWLGLKYDIVEKEPELSTLQFSVMPWFITTPEGDEGSEGLISNNYLGNQDIIFRLPIPSSIGSMKAVKIDHIIGYDDNGDPVIETSDAGIQGKDPQRYVEIKTTKFPDVSNFTLSFSNQDNDKSPNDNDPTEKYASGSGGSSSTIRNNGSWHQDNVGWWFAKTGGGYPADMWYECYWNGQMKWYHFNAQGYLDAGWFTDQDGATYYLHNQHDNHFGYMYTGWNWIDGKCYYFTPNTIAGGPKQGMLYQNGMTPDGYSVNETGAWTVNGAVQTK